MNLIKNRFAKKSVKLLILLLLSMLIASASAAVYYSMLAQPSVTITNAAVMFVQGSDWPTGSLMGTNSTWVSLALKAYPNATLTYDQPLNISNTDSSQHNFRLRSVSITPATGSASVGNFTSINFVVYNTTALETAGTPTATFSYNTTGNTWNTPPTTAYMQLPAGAQWIIHVDTTAAAGAQAITANIVISVDVQ